MVIIMSLKIKLEEYIQDPDEPTNSFEVGREYELIGQYASAMGYYLKCAELTDDDKLAYECLLRKAQCYNELPDRQEHVRNCCLLAIGLLPSRPEAYHLISIFYEKAGQWQESHAWSVAGQRLNGITAGDTFKDSLKRFKEVLDMDLSPEYINHVQWNINNLEGKNEDKLLDTKDTNAQYKEEIIKKILAKKDNINDSA